jgi:hypothetical protein
MPIKQIKQSYIYNSGTPQFLYTVRSNHDINVVTDTLAACIAHIFVFLMGLFYFTYCMIRDARLEATTVTSKLIGHSQRLRNVKQRYVEQRLAKQMCVMKCVREQMRLSDVCIVMDDLNNQAKDYLRDISVRVVDIKGESGEGLNGAGTARTAAAAADIAAADNITNGSRRSTRIDRPPTAPSASASASGFKAAPQNNSLYYSPSNTNTIINTITNTNYDNKGTDQIMTARNVDDVNESRLNTILNNLTEVVGELKAITAPNSNRGTTALGKNIISSSRNANTYDHCNNNDGGNNRAILTATATATLSGASATPKSAASATFSEVGAVTAAAITTTAIALTPVGAMEIRLQDSEIDDETLHGVLGLLHSGTTSTATKKSNQNNDNNNIASTSTSTSTKAGNNNSDANKGDNISDRRVLLLMFAE